jgi:hypothetical protein
MKSIRIFSASAVFLAAMCASSAFAATLPPCPTPGVAGCLNPTNNAPAVLIGGLPTGDVLVSETTSAIQTSPTLTGTGVAAVYMETAGACTGCLDFLYQVSPAAGDAIDSLTGQNFGNGLGVIETFYLDTLPTVIGSPFSAPTDTSPLTTNNVTWNPTSVQFDFNGITGGQESDIFVIRTDATTYSAGVALVQGTGQATFASYQPSPEPAQVGLLLGGLMVAGLFVARKFRVLQS